MKRLLHRSKKPFSIVAFFVFLLLALYVLSLIVALLWSFFTSLKGRLDYADNPFGWPKSWEFSNYMTAIDNFKSKNGVHTVYIEDMLLNSLIYSLGGSFLGSLFTACMAYVSARYKFKICGLIYALVVIVMILPIVGSLPSAIQITKALHLYDNYAGLLILQCSFLGPEFLIFYEAFKRIPKDYSDAAYIDGAGNFLTMTRVIFPMVSSTFFTIMLIKFVALWNSYNITLEFMPDIKTLAFGLYEYTQSMDADISTTPMRLAGCNILVIPILIFYAIFHKRLMGNYGDEGLKG